MPGKRKDFTNKKPEYQVQAEAVEALFNVPSAPDPEADQKEAPSSMPETIKASVSNDESVQVDQKEEGLSPTLSPAPFSRKSRANKGNKRSKRLQLLITEDEYNYLTAIAWLNRRSVNDYMNMLIEQDMKKNPDAKYTFNGGK